MNDDEIVTENLLVIPDTVIYQETDNHIVSGTSTPKNSLGSKIIQIVKEIISPSRTPQRSRANSIGNSTEDSDAPPTEERIEEMRQIVIQGLQASGFITDKSSCSKITSVVPR